MKKIIVTLLVIAFSISASHAAEKAKEPVKNDPKETLKMLDLFGDVFEKVRQDYVEEPKDKSLVESAINGMLTNLDPHSSYMDKESFEEMQTETKGAFGGLGIEVTMKNGLVYVVSPIDDTPAFIAGIKAGDYISHIDDISVMGMTLSDAVKKMRGKPGTDIMLTILREGAEEPLDVKIERAIVNVKSVKAKAEGDVGYVRITKFTETTGDDLTKELKKLKEEIGKNIKGVVLDLRNNPGGLLTQAIEVSDAFLDRGEIVSTRGRVPESTKRYNADKGDLIDGLPMVVLINGGSASASEIVAGALKDQKRALIMGTKSFGKGSVQTIIPMPEETAIRLTTALYYTPSGISIQAKGIEPDVNIEQAKVEFINSGKRNAEANLEGHIDNGDEEAKKDLKKPEEKSDAKKDSKEPKGTKDPKKISDITAKDEKKSLYETDYQLAAALDFLRGLYIMQKR